MKTRTVEAELFNTDEQTDERSNKRTGRHDEANSPFPNFTNTPINVMVFEPLVSALLASELSLILHRLRMFQIAHTRAHERTHALSLCWVFMYVNTIKWSIREINDFWNAPLCSLAAI